MTIAETLIKSTEAPPNHTNIKPNRFGSAPIGSYRTRPFAGAGSRKSCAD